MKSQRTLDMKCGRRLPNSDKTRCNVNLHPAFLLLRTALTGVLLIDNALFTALPPQNALVCPKNWMLSTLAPIQMGCSQAFRPDPSPGANKFIVGFGESYPASCLDVLSSDPLHPLPMVSGAEYFGCGGSAYEVD